MLLIEHKIQIRGWHMKQVLLDGSRMMSRQDAYKYLAEQFQFSHYSRYNLNALWKMLLEAREPYEIDLKNSQLLLAGVPDYGLALLRTLLDVSQANENVRFHYENDII